MSTDVIIIEIRADGSDAAATLQKVSDALKESGDSAEHAKEGFSDVQAAIITLREGFELAKEAIQRVYEILIEAQVKWSEQVVELGHVSEALGISIQTMDQLNQASYLLTGQTDGLSTMMLRLERNLGQAASGIGPAKDAIAALGISVADLLALPADQQLRVVIAGLAGIKDPAERSRDAMLLFGRQWQDLIPLMKDSGKGLDDAIVRAKDLGRVLNDETIKAAEHLVQAQRDLNLAWENATTRNAGYLDFLATVYGWWKRILDVASGQLEVQRRLAGQNLSAGGVTGGQGESGSFDPGNLGLGGSQLDLLQASASAASALQDQATVAAYVNLAQTQVAAAQLASLPDIDDAAIGALTFADASNSAAGLLSELPAILKKGLKAFGIDTSDVGGALDTAAGNLNSMLGTSMSGAALGGGIGAAFALLMQNPVMQAEMAKLNKLLQDLITPIAEAVAPALDALAPIMVELKPVFQIIADVLKVGLMPTLAELHALNQILKPIMDALNGLKHAIESFNPFGGSGGGGGIGGTNITAADIVTGGAAAVFGYADGGLITANRMLTPPGVDGGGLIFAHEGETVVPRGGAGHTFNFNVSAPDARAAGQSIRQIVEEMSVRKQFALAGG